MRLDPMEQYAEDALRRRDPRRIPRVLKSAIRLTWRADHRGFLFAASLQLIGAGCAIALVLVGKRAIDAILTVQEGGSGKVSDLLPVVLAMAVVTALAGAASGSQQHQQRLLTERTSIAVWQRLLDVTGRVGLEFFESPRFFDQLQRVQTNAITQPVTVTRSVFGLIGGVAGTAGLLVALLSVEPLLIPLLLLAGIPTVLLSRRASRTEFAFIVEASPLYRRREYLRSLLTGRSEAKEVRAFGAARALRAKHDEQSVLVVASVRRQVRTRQFYALAQVAMSALALTATLMLLVWFVSTGRIGLAEAGAAAIGVRLLSSRLDQTFKAVAALFESSVFLDDLEHFLTIAGDVNDEGTGRRLELLSAVEVQGVSYAYPNSSTGALQDVSLRIGRGEVVALVGENGSGKTTLAKVIAGLYPPTHGRVMWDDVDAATRSPDDVRRGVAVIFQDFVKYHLSAVENIGIGNPAASDDEAAAIEAGRRAGADRFLAALPNGYRTVLSKEYAGGVDLSIGQWQRVALARALRRDAPLVVLDEPTSALDPRAEHDLFQDMKALLQGRSALLISHRFSSVRAADRIYVLEAGRVVEHGTHDELMALGGLYADLFSLQAKAYL